MSDLGLEWAGWGTGEKVPAGKRCKMIYAGMFKAERKQILLTDTFHRLQTPNQRPGHV